MTAPIATVPVVVGPFHPDETIVLSAGGLNGADGWLEAVKKWLHSARKRPEVARHISNEEWDDSFGPDVPLQTLPHGEHETLPTPLWCLLGLSAKGCAPNLIKRLWNQLTYTSTSTDLIAQLRLRNSANERLVDHMFSNDQLRPLLIDHAKAWQALGLQSDIPHTRGGLFCGLYADQGDIFDTTLSRCASSWSDAAWAALIGSKRISRLLLNNELTSMNRGTWGLTEHFNPDGINLLAFVRVELRNPLEGVERDDRSVWIVQHLHAACITAAAYYPGYTVFGMAVYWRQGQAVRVLLNRVKTEVGFLSVTPLDVVQAFRAHRATAFESMPPFEQLFPDVAEEWYSAIEGATRSVVVALQSQSNKHGFVRELIALVFTYLGLSWLQPFQPNLFWPTKAERMPLRAVQLAAALATAPPAAVNAAAQTILTAANHLTPTITVRSGCKRHAGAEAAGGSAKRQKRR